MKYFLGIAIGTFLGVLWTKAWGWEWATPLLVLLGLWVVGVVGFWLGAVMTGSKQADESLASRPLYRGPQEVA